MGSINNTNPLTSSVNEIFEYTCQLSFAILSPDFLSSNLCHRNILCNKNGSSRDFFDKTRKDVAVVNLTSINQRAKRGQSARLYWVLFAICKCESMVMEQR